MIAGRLPSEELRLNLQPVNAAPVYEGYKQMPVTRLPYRSSAGVFMVAIRPICVAENDYKYFASSFFQTLFLRPLCTDFLKTVSHDVGSSAIEYFSSTSS